MYKADVENYIHSFPQEVQQKLKEMRNLITHHAPDAVESMSYGVIGYKYQNKPLLYFGAAKKHIGFYATPSGNSAFQKLISKYKHGKGSIQFPLHEPLPIDLIIKIIQFRLSEM